MTRTTREQRRARATRYGRQRVALVGRGLVGRRGAAHRGGDVGAVSTQAVVAVALVGWFAQPGRCRARNSQSPERSPVNTRPVRLPPWAAGRQADHQQRGVGIAEAGHRPAPVVPVAERRPLLARDLLAPRHQARAGADSATISACDRASESTAATVGWRPPCARRASRTPPTLVLLVRHGQTPTTGKLLPGRAPGPAPGRRRAGPGRGGGRAHRRAASRSTPCTPRRSSGPGRRRRRSPPLAA